MHRYYIDDEIRNRVVLICAVLALLSGYVFHLLTDQFKLSFEWWVETPSVLGFLGLFLWLFDNYIWKAGWIQHLKILHIPNLNGTWMAQIKSSYDNLSRVIPATAIIRQTSSRICISLETETSTSSSVYASFVKSETLDTYQFMYYYINRPKAGALGTMNMHEGTNWFRVSDDLNSLTGEYYTGRGRQNYGTITLARIVLPTTN